MITGFGNGYDGAYSSKGFSNSKQVFIKTDDDNKCIWWHRRYRHWWIGTCDNIGTNSGYAYISNDVQCPDASNINWRRGGSDEYLNNIKERYPGCHSGVDEYGRSYEVKYIIDFENLGFRYKIE